MTVADNIFQRAAGAEARVTAYDGSEAGSSDSGVGFRLRSPKALADLAAAPGSRGLARAYVTGELEIEGQPHTALSEIAEVTPHDPPRPARIRSGGELLGTRLRYRVPVSPTEVRPHGRLHSKHRDREAGTQRCRCAHGGQLTVSSDPVGSAQGFVSCLGYCCADTATEGYPSQVRRRR